MMGVPIMMIPWRLDQLHVNSISIIRTTPTPEMAFCICSLDLDGKVREIWMNVAISMATGSPLMTLRGIRNMTFLTIIDGERWNPE